MIRNANEISIEEAAVRAQASRASVDRWLRVGHIQGIRRGNRVFIEAQTLTRFLAGTPFDGRAGVAPIDERRPGQGGAEGEGDVSAAPK